jgi:adenylate kinase
MASIIVLLGAPGAGKGTQAKFLHERTGFPHISSGDIFRENLQKQTELGKLAQGYMTRGELVPDDVTIAMIRDRLSQPDCEKGVILDGFPRTVPQAKALDALLGEIGLGEVKKVPYVKVSEKALVDRLSGRWSCKLNGHVYHALFNPPKKAGICDIDGSELFQREDDKSETVQRRIRVYFEQTAPLIEYYRAKNVLIEIDGEGPIDQVTKTLLKKVLSESS